MITGAAMAQTKEVSGTVSDSTGAPIAGATIRVVGGRAGTATDANGNFKFTVLNNIRALMVSALGFEAQTVELTGGHVNVVLSRSEGLVEAGDEVIITAYGRSTRSTFTGAATAISADAIEKRPIASITKALDGVTPGVISTLGSGQPGSDAGIRIRGFGSINASSAPLYVVDGVPFTGDLNSINPNDVENITVLKDAAASTLYGSRAANGVVMITTKSGRNTAGRINVNFKASLGISSPAVKRYDVMNTKEYLETVFQSYKNQEIFEKGIPELQAGINALNRMKGTVDPIFGVNEQYNPYNVPVNQLIDPVTGILNPNAQLKWNDNWLDEVIAKNPVRQEYQLDLSGGGEKLKAFASINALKENGLLKTTSFERFTGRVSTEFTPKDWFKASLSANFSKGESNFLNTSTPTATSNVWYSAEQMAPIYPIYERDANGDYVLDASGNRLFDYGRNRGAGAQQNFNSIAVLYDDKYFDYRNNVGTRASIEFNTDDVKYGAFQGFSLAFNLGSDYLDNAYTYYYNPYFGNAAGSGRLNKEWTKSFSYTFNQLLTWNRLFGQHSFDVLLGHENYSYKFNLLSAQKTGFPFGGIYELAPGSSIADATSYENNDAMESYFSRLQYNFSNKYYFTASFRTDGSSRFFVDNRWGNFWSMGGAWKISEENFLKDQEWINSLTLRSSYGEQGNNSLGTFYAWQAFYDLTWNNANNNGGTVTSVENKKVSWEKSQNLNVGMDGRFLDNRLTLEFEWYTRKTTDMLLNRPLALSTGFDGFNDNVGDMKNSGIEFSVGYDVIRNANLTWNITAMGSKVKNKVLKLTDEQNEIISGTTIIRVGEPVNSFFMARSAGVDPSNGDQLYWVFDKKEDEFDVSKHYVSNDKSKAAASRVIVGNRIPKFLGSLSTSVNYRKFDFSLLTTYSIGGKIYDVIGYNYLNPLYIGNNLSREVLRAWKQPGDITDIPRLQKELTHTINDRALVDASYFAIKNASIGYTFDLKRAGLSSLRYFIQGENLAIFSARQGLNPQFNFTGTTDYAYTPNRIVSMGINLNF